MIIDPCVYFVTRYGSYEKSAITLIFIDDAFAAYADMMLMIAIYRLLIRCRQRAMRLFATMLLLHYVAAMMLR